MYVKKAGPDEAPKDPAQTLQRKEEGALPRTQLRPSPPAETR